MQKLGEGSRLVTEEIQGHGDLSLQQNLSNRKWAVLETTSLEGDIAYSWSNDQNVFFVWIFQNLQLWNTILS